MTTKAKTKGGARVGAGGTVSKIHISKERAAKLRTLLNATVGRYSAEEVGGWVERQIDAACTRLVVEGDNDDQ